MAKKPVHKQLDVIRKDGGPAVVLDDEISIDGVVYRDYDDPTTERVDGQTFGADNTALWAYDHLATDSDGKPRFIVPDDTPQQPVSLILPRAVLIALLDPAHELADAATATGLGLLQDGAVTAIGALVIAGTDKTALGHKMAAAWRNAHNAKVLSKKG